MSDPKQKMLVFGFVVVLWLASVNSQALDFNAALIYVTMAPNVSYVNVMLGDPVTSWLQTNSTPSPFSLPLVGQYKITQTDFDYQNRRGFWAETNGGDHGGRSLGYVNLDPSQLVNFQSGAIPLNPIYYGTSSSTRGIAVDWIGNNVYWTDGIYNWIAVTPIVPNLNNISVLVQIDEEEPGGIVVYPKKGLMFWTAYGGDGRIYKATMSGDNRNLIMQGNMKPSGIAIDYTSETLYWIDELSGQIRIIDMNGNNNQVIYTDNGAQFYGITVYKGHLFLTEQNNNTIDILDIASKTKVRSVVIPSQSGTAFDIEVYADGIQEEYTSPCATAGCEHFCVLEPNNGTKCMCNSGYILQDNGLSCAVDSLLRPQFVFASTKSIQVYPFNFPDREQSEILRMGQSSQMHFSQWHNYTTVAFNFKSKMLYGSDNSYRSIYSWNYAPNQNGQPTRKTPIDGTDNIRGLAVDWVSSHIYWTERTLGYLSVAELDGFRQTILLRNLNQPKALVVDPVITKSLFWVEGDVASVIKRSNLDGSGVQIFQPNNGGIINGLHIDFGTQRLYWTDSANIQLNSCFLNGTDQKTLVQGFNSNYMQGPLTSYKDYIIWVGAYLNAANIRTGEVVKNISEHRLYSNIMDVISFDSSMQPDMPDACGSDNGGCEHLCLPLLNDQISCICSLGYKVSATDPKKCESVAKLTDNFILVADPGRREIFQMDMQGQTLSAIKLESEHDFPRSMAVDPNNDLIYWVDTDIIKRIHVDGSQEEVFMQFDQVAILRRIAIDPKAGLMFYTNDGENQIGMITLNKKYHKIILGADSGSEVDRPHDIEVDHEENRIYWTDWGISERIERAYYDGSGRMTIASRQLYYPFGLSVDYRRRKLYWAEGMYENIEECYLDGTGRRVIYSRPSSFFHSLHIHGDYLYFSDTWVNNIHKIYYNGSGEVTVGPEEFGVVIDTFVYIKADFPAFGGPCANNNGGCSHICLPRGSTKTCDCPTGQTLKDDRLNCGDVVTCPKPTIQYGSLDIQCNYRNGTVCAINCDFGYRPDYPSARCLGTNWNITFENVCKEQNPNCPPVQITNGSLTTQCQYTFGSVCYVQCDMGFLLTPHSFKALCQQGGQWNTSFTNVCQVALCPRPDIQNGYLDRYCDPRPGGVCSVECADGYSQTNPNFRVQCNPNGNWNSTFNNVCEASMCPRSEIENGRLNTRCDLYAGGICQVACNPGFALTDANFRVQCQRDGTWNSTFDGVCRVAECDPTVVNGQMNPGCTFRHGTVCTVRCDTGYTSNPGNLTVTCRIDGSWNSTLQGVCQPSGVSLCPFPEVPNGAIDKNCSRGLNQVCAITCKDGFSPKRGKALCEEEGGWNTTFSDECVANVCPVVNGTNLIWNPRCSRQAGSYCPIICAKEYEPIPRKLLAHCRMNGTWTVDFNKVCHDVTPPVLTCDSDRTVNADPGSTTKVVTFSNPTVSDNSGEFGIRVMLSIKSGVRFGEGTTVIHAYARDSAGNIGSCSFKVTVDVPKCPELVLDTATTLVDSNCPPILGSVCYVKCKDGYYMKGATYFMCSKTMPEGSSTPKNEWEHIGDDCIPIKEAPTAGPAKETDNSNDGTAGAQSGSDQKASPLTKAPSNNIGIVVALVIIAILAILLILCIAFIVCKRWSQPGGVFALFKRPTDDSSVRYRTQQNEIDMSASPRGANGGMVTSNNDYMGDHTASGIANPLYETLHQGVAIPSQPPTYSSINLRAEGYDQAPPLPAKDESGFSDIATLPVVTNITVTPRDEVKLDLREKKSDA